MLIIHRYFAKQIIVMGLAITILATFALLLGELTYLIRLTAKGELLTSKILQILLLELPNALTLMLPFGLYIGLLLTYSRLYANSEMIVVTACGYSRAQLVRFTTFIAALFALLAAVFTLWINPNFERTKQEIYNSLGESMLIQALVPGRFQQTSDGRHLFYVESSGHDNTVHNIFMVTLPATANDIWDVIYAKEGIQEVNPITDDNLFTLTDGHRYLGEPGKQDYRIIKFGSYQFKLPERNQIIETSHQEDSTLTLWNNRNSDIKALTELQWRFSIPLSVFILAIIAIPLSTTEARRGKYAKFLPAIILFFIYVNLLVSTRTWIERGIIMYPAVIWLVHGLFLAIGASLYLNSFTWQKLRGRTR